MKGRKNGHQYLQQYQVEERELEAVQETGLREYSSKRKD